MEALMEEQIERYAFSHTQKPPELLDRLEQETRSIRSDFIMLTGRAEGQFLRLLAQIMNATRILEVGMYTGYSALMMASALDAKGELHTCEIDPQVEEVAKRYFKESPYGHKIHVHMGPALETLVRLSGRFDLAFVDADKGNYPNYYDLILPRLRVGGLLVFDNVLWSGKVLNPRDRDTKAIHELNGRVQRDERVDNVLTTIRDGILLVRKRTE